MRTIVGGHGNFVYARGSVFAVRLICCAVRRHKCCSSEWWL